MKLIFIILLLNISRIFAYECNQKLYEAKGEPTHGYNGFSLQIHSIDSTDLNNNKTQPLSYVPGKSYIVVLRGWRTQFFVQTFRGFGITATLESNGKAGGKFNLKKVNFSFFLFNLFRIVPVVWKLELLQVVVRQAFRTITYAQKLKYKFFGKPLKLVLIV